MKRSRSIRRVLLGVSAGVLAGCGPGPGTISSECYYTNNYQVKGLGYYHAPFRGWYPFQYNQYNPSTHQYFFGGRFASSPHESITNISTPTVEAARLAQTTATDYQRGGFGRSSHYHSIHS